MIKAKALKRKSTNKTAIPAINIHLPLFSFHFMLFTLSDISGSSATNRKDVITVSAVRKNGCSKIFFTVPSSAYTAINPTDNISMVFAGVGIPIK